MNLCTFAGACLALVAISPATHSQSEQSPTIVVVIDFNGDDTGVLVLGTLDWVAATQHLFCTPGPGDFLEGRMSKKDGSPEIVPYLLDEISIRCSGRSTGYVIAVKHSATRITLSGYYETSGSGLTGKVVVDETLSRVEATIKTIPQIQHIVHASYSSDFAKVNIK